jgi:hypothetical protein
VIFTSFDRNRYSHLVKLVPVVGGMIGGTMDAVTTNLIGNVARAVFIQA